MSAASGTPSTTPTTTSQSIILLTPIPIPTPITASSSSSTTSSTSTSSSSSSSSASSSSSDSRTSSSSTSSSASSSASTTSTTSSTSKTSISSSSSTSNLPAVITEVSTTFISESQSGVPTAASVKNGTSNAFFENKGAVAGVFSVVGLIGLVILIALIINIVRRHKARKFDKELFLATQDAAATAPDLNFPDDDERKDNVYPEVYGQSEIYGQSDGYGHSEVYGQPDVYGQPMDAFRRAPAGGEFYHHPGNGAGIGAHRLGNVHYGPYESAYPPYPGDSYGGPPGVNNVHAAPIIPTGHQYPQRSPPPDLGRSKSNSTAASHSAPSHYSNHPQPSAAAAALPNPHTEERDRKPKSSGESADDALAYGGAAYGGYVESDVEEEPPKRVLKIANES